MPGTGRQSADRAVCLSLSCCLVGDTGKAVFSQGLLACSLYNLHHIFPPLVSFPHL